MTNSTKPLKKSKEEPTAQDTAEVPPEVKVDKTSNLLEKAKFISDLAAVWQNNDVKKLLLAQPNGDAIYEVFSTAINNKIADTMSGKASDEISNNVNDLSENTKQMAAAMGNFRDLINSFMSSPLVQVLDLMNKNLGGRSGALPPMYQQQQPQPSQYAPQAEPYDGGGGRQSIVGLGSF